MQRSIKTRSLKSRSVRLLSLTATMIFSVAATLAFADEGAYVVGTPCKDRVTAIESATETRIRVSRATYRRAGEALKHYRDVVLDGQSRDPDFEVHIEKVVELKDTSGNFLGRKVGITDGGDESLVEYYFDQQNKLVTGFWHNQSPVRYWFCE